MKGIILAAGRGVRMGDMTTSKPKCLIRYKDKTLLEHQLDSFKKSDISDIAIVKGYKKEMLSRFNLKEFENLKWDKTNMVCSLLCADEYLKNSPCIISYSDIVYSEEAIKILKGCQNDLAITYDPNWLQLWSRRFKDPLVDAETFKIDKDNMLVTEIGKKAKNISEIQGQYMGLIYINPRGWNKLKSLIFSVEISERNRLSMTELFQIAINKNLLSLYGYPYKGYWAEFDSISDLKLEENK